MTAPKPLSYRERQAQAHVAFEDNLPPETEQEAAARVARNDAEWKLARADAVRRKDAKAVQALDAERAARRGIDFSDDLGFEPDLDFQPDAPRASQADVRASEPQPTPMERQRSNEATFENQFQSWLQATGGKLKPGQNVRQAVAEFAAMQDPRETRDSAVTENLRETGELDGMDDTLGMQVAKPAAAVAGFALGGPAGATGAEAAVRYLTLATNLDRAVKAGAIDEDRAAEILVKEMAKGTATDAAFNFGLPILGQLAMKIPGAKWITDKAGKLVERMVGPSAPKPTLRDAKLESRAKLTDDPARQAAVHELGRRTEGVVPTPGQVRGEAGATETVINKAFPAAFEKQEKALVGAADDMLRETTNPAGQPAAQALGLEIQRTADATQEAVKKRLRPAFEAADKIGVKVDMSEVKGRIRKALLMDSRVPGGNLAPVERAQLASILDDINKNPMIGAEQALDFISRRKEQLRATTADWKPSKAYDTIIGDLTTAADTAFVRAAGNAGKGDVVRDLLAAQRDYKEMMGTIYDDAIKAALKKNPEDVGRFLWQGGNVSEPQQLQRMFQIAQREGKLSAQKAQELSASVTRGFLQEAVPSVEAAAAWSKTLKENPAKRRTWEELTSAPGGKQLREAMTVLEHAAQMATVRNTAANKTMIPIGRAASGGLGVSYVTGMIHPGMAVAGLSIAGTMKAMSTAYMHGDKGAINLMAKVLRSNSAGTGAAAKALQSMLPDLERIAQKYGADDIFVPAEETE